MNNEYGSSRQVITSILKVLVDDWVILFLQNDSVTEALKN
jgi:hypothetical protein